MFRLRQNEKVTGIIGDQPIPHRHVQRLVQDVLVEPQGAWRKPALPIFAAILVLLIHVRLQNASIDLGQLQPKLLKVCAFDKL